MITWLRSNLTRRGPKDKGFVLLSTMTILLTLLGSVVMIMNTTMNSITNARNGDVHIRTGQLADTAVQTALYQLNEGSLSTLPTAASPATGTADGGDWSWYAKPIITDNAGRKTTIVAQGTFNGTTRKVEVNAGAPKVGGFKAEANKELVYEVSPETAFAHVLFGRDIKAQNGAGITGSQKFLTGVIGATGENLDLALASGTTAAKDVSYTLYGGAAGARTLPDAIKAPVSLKLDPQLITENMSRCGSAAPEDWVASRSGGRLIANGNVGCYRSMTFDVPTTVQGTGAYSAFVSGNVTVSDRVSMAATAGLNIYSGGNVTFRTEDTAATALTVGNVHVYAPNGTCQTQPFRSGTKALKLTGGLACDTIKVAGQVTHKDALSPVGGATYSNEIWYLTDYRQPSGHRG